MAENIIVTLQEVIQKWVAVSIIIGRKHYYV